jgi:hypothetical protein
MRVVSDAVFLFMLQKPSVDVIRELVHDFFFLMDMGIWLLSPEAADVLMGKNGWKGDCFNNGVADDYDLYGGFGPAMGRVPDIKDEEITGLSVALVNLEEGEFYHLGNTSELVDTNLAACP